MDEPYIIEDVVNHNGYISRLTGLYFYTVSWDALAYGANADNELTIQNNTDFLWLATLYRADIAYATQERSTEVVPLLDLELFDTGNPFMSAPTPIQAVAGGPVNGPLRLDKPRWLYGGAVLSVKAYNQTDATNPTSYDFELTLVGYQYKRRNDQG